MLVVIRNLRLRWQYAPARRRRAAAATTAAVAAAVSGLLLLGASQAADLSANIQAENGIVSGNAALTQHVGASGGSAVRFGGGNLAKLAGFERRASGIAKFLEPNVKPPTNQWFSNLAFKQPSDPVFAYPLALQTMPNGFGMMHPKIVSTTNTVFGSYVHHLMADVGTVNTRILSYDDLSVTLLARDAGGAPVAEYRLTQGSPVIYVTLKQGRRLTLGGPSGQGAPVVSQRAGYHEITSNGSTYVASHDNAITVNTGNSTLSYSAGSEGRLAIGILPANSTDTATFVARMQDPLVSSTVGYGAAASTVSTQFSLTSRANKGGLMALLPVQQAAAAPGPLLGTYPTLLGTIKLYAFSDYTFPTSAPAPPTTLDVGKITAAEKTEIVAALVTDITNLPAKGFTASDTYFGGKQLARAANMLMLARQLGQPNLAQQAYDAIDAQMVLWLNPNKGSRSDRYFYYDTNLMGLVGVKPSFGSDTEFNDHHFHYGYFIYAAGIMAQHNPAFVAKHAEIINSLVRDIAGSDRSDPFFPYLRPFDQYAGHAWASGTSPFADGNNNESSSEAVNAWYGLYLWAKASNNGRLETLSRWLYGRESDAALAYWTNFDRTQPQFVNYKPSVVSMVWGGKMDYGTWFSASSYAKLGIQILPVTPASGYLGRDAARVQTNLTNLNDGSAAMFTDVMTMYRSFSDPTGAAAAAKALPDAQLDDGNSRSWLLAWTYSH